MLIVCKQKLVFMDMVIAVTVTKDGEPIFKTMLPGFVGEDASYAVPRSYAMMPDRKFASVVSTAGGCLAKVAAKGGELRIIVPAAALPAAADDRTQDLAVTVDISDCDVNYSPGLMLIVR